MKINPFNTGSAALPSGLKYTEETNRTERSLPMRDCFLWQDQVAEPVSGLNVVSFRQRFGAVSIPAEGIGGVETLPAFRQKGHMTTLMRMAVAGIASRVPVAFVSDGIQGVYEKFGFVNCLAKSNFSLRVRDVERFIQFPPVQGVREFSPEDLPSMVRLYNQANAQRPWTHERHAEWNRLHAPETWRPGSAAVILEQEDRITGYAIFQEAHFGHPDDSLFIDELIADNPAAAQVLLSNIASRCWEMRIGEFSVREPLDSVVGRAAQRFGCTQSLSYLPSGGMMGMILDRRKLLHLLEPELLRRLPGSELHPAHSTAFEALCSGNIIPDNRDLIRLLVGHWSMTQARDLGIIPEQHAQVLNAWFPGGGTQFLQHPYSHSMDRY